ncbi:hexose kinase [Vagococcus silagei]|uniref:Tagatose-6-phosphate kinase n=1 Tax=Vagococcus silagei TaxID=2508885 RepID=A0A4S3B5J8_9ENTE|nr:hexose kinase [Vagococcus silagei]THB62371.1 tagatose-6-phosphate kinase [Vagococcus silagei]
MVLAITLNPSLDISYPIETLKINDVNRCQTVSKTAGGKGLNVARVIHQMDGSVVATGFLGGNIGKYIEDQLTEQEIQHQFQHINGETRNCIAILHDQGQQTEVLEGGPTLSVEDLEKLKALLEDLVGAHDVVTISGSLSKGLPEDSYVQLIEQLNAKNKKVILDSSGGSLKAVLNSNVKPYAIKPNLTEIEELTGVAVSLEDLTGLKSLLLGEQFMAIPLIVISLGADGAFVKSGKQFYRVTIPKINVVNPVGSGDSTVAGLALALEKQASLEEILKTAMALGLLNTMEQKTGFVNPLNFDKYFELVKVEEI